MKAEKRRLWFAIAALAVLITTSWNVFSYFSNYNHGFIPRVDSDLDAIVAYSVEPDGAAHSAGLQQGDIIVSVNSSIIDVNSDGWRQRLGDELRKQNLNLGVLRGETVVQMSIQGAHLEFTPQFIAFFGVGILYIVMGTWVFFARPNYEAASAWGFFALLMGGFVTVMSLSISGSMDFIYLLVAVLFAGQIFFSAAAGLHFALIFPRVSKLAKRRWVIPAVYMVPAALLFLVAMMFFMRFFFQGIWEPLSYLPTIISVLASSYWIIYIGLIVIALVRSYMLTTELTEKRRMRAIIFGTAIPLGLMLLVVLVYNFFGNDLEPPELLMALILAVIPITYFYAIVRHRAMQMQVILRRGLIYSIVTTAVLVITGVAFVAVFGLMLLLQDLLPSLGREGGTFNSLAKDENVQKFTIAVWSVLIGATFGNLKRRVQTWVDKRFYRERYSYRQALKKLTQVLEQTHDRSKMLQIVVDNAHEMVHPRSVALVLLQPEGHGLVEKASPEALEQLTLKRDSIAALQSVFEANRTFLGMRELNEEKLDDNELLHAALMRLGADICLPMKTDRGCCGYIFLGGKRSESSYNLEEIELLKLLADQAARGIEHMNLASEAAEKEKLRRELEIGRQIQQNLLPSSLPDIPGLEIAAINSPAMEVGGDFYTFIPYGHRKLGIIVGDIIGKGVAGALNMAATISSLRLIAEESTSVTEALQRLNRYLVKNTSTRSFAAVLFAILDLDEGVLRWANAGLPEPVYVPRQGKVGYLESETYALPPGASMHSAYMENSIKIGRGDSVVIVSDGCVETRPNGEEGDDYGFERLLEFVEKNRHRSPSDLVEVLRNDIHDFRGSMQLEDDFTAVAFCLKSVKDE